MVSENLNFYVITNFRRKCNTMDIDSWTIKKSDGFNNKFLENFYKICS